MLAVDVRKRLGAFDLRACFDAGGETLVLFGPSGSGKSLTLAAIAGLLRPDAGRIVLDGEPLFDSERRLVLPPERRRVGYVPQGYALFPHLSVRQNVAYGLAGLPRAEAERRVREAAALLGLEPLLERRTHQISGGQQQRVALARALVVEPRLLLLDEPFAALDAEIRRTLRAELVELQRRLGFAVLFVTHDRAEAHAVGRRVAVFDQGRVLQSGATDDVFNHPASRRVAELTATRNIFPGEVLGRRGDGYLVRVGSHEIETGPQAGELGGAVELCIRPEHVLLVRKEKAPHHGPRRNVLRGRIEREVAQGAFHTLYVRTDGGLEVEIDVPDHPYEVMGVAGEREWDVSLKPSAIHLIPRFP